MRLLTPCLTLVLVTSAALMPPVARAETFTAFAARVEPDRNGFDPATVGGVRISGRPFGFYGLKGRIALEAGTDIDEGKTPGGRAFGFTTYGAYITARTRGAFYLLGEYGIARNRIDVDGGRDTTEKQTRTSLGLGFTTGNLRIEATAGQFDDSSKLADSTWITLGVRF